MEKPAINQYPIHELIKQRWSPVAFNNRPIEATKVASLLEAARWAASCFNEQPWSFIVATQDNSQEYNKLLSCLVEANQKWAKDAPLLILSVAKLTFEHNGKPNRHAWHDVGLALGNLTLQAQSFGLFVHQMAGFDGDKARSLYNIPQNYEPVTALAVGYPGNASQLAPDLAERQLSPRTRKPFSDFVFRDRWGESYL
ncbi:MAG: nitroreductase family protein [Crocosphaera sp.]|nr:nitroreductase family protein [Crocosphaera sp.]